MARAYGQDLRDRVIDAALAGMPARQAAARFGVGHATAIVWVRRARAGERGPRKQGQPRRCKLDAHRAYLRGLLAATPDLTISELQERLLAERGVHAARSTLWSFLDRDGLTHKKSPRTPPSRRAKTWRGRARPGSRPSPISSPSG